MQKYQIYTIIALLIMTLGFTIPTLCFHGMNERIKANLDLPSYVYPIYNIYTRIQYKNHLLDESVKNDLKKLIQARAEIGVPSLPVWYVSLEAPNYPKAAFPNGIPVYFHIDGYSGDVSEMNTLNHYIGMYPMEYGGNVERAIAPYYLLVATLLMLLYLLQWQIQRASFSADYYRAYFVYECLCGLALLVWTQYARLGCI